MKVDDSFNTSTGVVLGTPHYISPEQARGEPLDLRSDIYSLGIALYEMVTGRRPFGGTTAVEVLAHHLHSPMPALPSSTGKLAPHLEHAIGRMTEKRAADRPGSYVELASLLQGAPPARQLLHRYGRLPLPLLAGSLLLAGIVLVGFWQRDRPDVMTYDEGKVDVPPTPISGRFDSGFGVLAPGADRPEGCLGAISVVLDFVITDSGEVVGITADDPKLAGEAILSLSQRRYSPALVKGRPVRMRSRARFTNSSEFKTLAEFRSQALLIEQSRMPKSQALACLDELARQLKADDQEFRAEAQRALLGIVRAYSLGVPELISIGKTLADASQSAAASQVLEAALARIPDTGREYERIADGLAAAGDRDRALKAYQLAVAVDPRLDSARDKATAIKPGAAPTPEDTYKGARVYLEADVETNPLLRSHQIPKPRLAPGEIYSVHLSWIVTPEGEVYEPRVIASSSPDLDALILEEIRKWRYDPGKQDGKPVPVRVVRKYTFGSRAAPQPSPNASRGAASSR